MVEIESQIKEYSLQELAIKNLSYGSGASAIKYDGNMRYIRITDLNENGGLKEEKVSPSEIDEKFILKKGDILFARSGATVGKNYIKEDDDRCLFAGYLIRMKCNAKLVLPKFVFYSINTSKYKSFISETKSSGSQPNINAKQYSTYKILVPSLEIQELIINILEKFDKISNSLVEGLPKEIELRQKQYEYYREKLLSFEKES